MSEVPLCSIRKLFCSYRRECSKLSDLVCVPGGAAHIALVFDHPTPVRPHPAQPFHRPSSALVVRVHLCHVANPHLWAHLHSCSSTHAACPSIKSLTSKTSLLDHSVPTPQA